MIRIEMYLEPSNARESYTMTSKPTHIGQLRIHLCPQNSHIMTSSVMLGGGKDMKNGSSWLSVVIYANNLTILT